MYFPTTINYGSVSEYKQKKVLALAPDALVFLNGNSDIPICLKCNAKEDLKNDITNISTSLGIEGAPGSASFTIVAPTKTFETKYIKDGKLAITEMMEVKIFIKGRFADNDGYFNYYPVFWGLVSSVTDSFSAGEYTINVECKDILRWWQIMKVNIHPSVITAKFSGQQPNALGSRYANMNPFQIILSLAEYGAQNLMSPASYIQTAGAQDSIKYWRNANEKMIEYWANRFRQVGKNIKIYGYLGSVQGNLTVEEAYIKGTRKLELQGKKTPSPRVKMIQNNDFLPFYEFKQFDLTESEYMSKLDMALEVKNYINYEFFMDVDGHIVFKPPFYNLDVRPNNPYSIIEDIDLVSWDFTGSEEEVITRLDVSGYISPQFKTEVRGSIYGYYCDYNLAKKFGLRQQSITVRQLKTKKSCTLYAINELAKINSKRFSGSLTIMGRPELKLGFPIYIPSRDCFYYVTSITHSFTFGSTFTTTLGLEARRVKRVDHEVSTEEDGVVKNGAMVFVKEELPENETNFQPSPQQEVEEQLEQQQKQAEPIQHIGLYKLVANKKVDIVNLEKNEIPVSDKDGYELIGGFTYGKNLQIDSEGNIVAGDNKTNVAKYLVMANPVKEKDIGKDKNKSHLNDNKEPEGQVSIANKGQALSEVVPSGSKSRCSCITNNIKIKLGIMTKAENEAEQVKNQKEQDQVNSQTNNINQKRRINQTE